MLIESGVVERRDGHWYATQAAADVRVPDSVEALIRARLDTLPAPERVLLQSGAVVGRVFQRSAVASIAPPEQVPPPLEPHLEDAILRDIITDERSPDEPTFRFRHILIRDVAYNTLPKARRAELHGGVARWLREWAGSRMDEFVEIEAYHLEQSVKLKREVGAPVDDVVLRAATDALLHSARKASTRQDFRATRTFAERGLALAPSSPEARVDLTWYLAEALYRLGEYTRSGEVAAVLEAEAQAAGRRDLEGRAVFIRGASIWIRTESADASKGLAEVRRARDILTEAEDWAYLPLVLETLGYEGWWYGDLDKATVAWKEMAEVAGAHGQIDMQAQALVLLARAMRNKSGYQSVVGDLINQALELAERGGSRMQAARIRRQLGAWMSIDESAEKGLENLLAAAAVLDELGDVEELALALQFAGDIAHQQGRLQEAVAHCQRSLDLLADHVGYKPETERRLASIYLEMGDVASAAAMAEDAVEVVADDDWFSVASTGSVLGTVRAAQGRLTEAESLLREAVHVLEGREFPETDIWLNLAEFLCRHGQPAEGREWLARLRDLIDRRYRPGGPMWTYLGERIAAAEAEATAAEGGAA
jgi:tetratricopeptide (TPR) repeat protein